MPRFTQMLQQAYVRLGHEVDVWSPKALAYRCVPPGPFKKWAGYIDQYLLFPFWVRLRLRREPTETLFVFCDQALGPWVPLVRHRSHVVHVHDLLALRSALGEIPENPTSWTGRLYQRYIRWGFAQARCFISISAKTQEDLHRVGNVKPEISEVVYNGLNYAFAPMEEKQATLVLAKAGLQVPALGMLLHVSGGQWYKNMPGVIALYCAYAKANNEPLDLWCISPAPSAAVKAMIDSLPRGKVYFFQNLDNAVLAATYSLSRVFILPSLAEGFGWPIVEAQACGCPVITTDAAPMNEVGGSAARYLRKLTTSEPTEHWAREGGALIAEVARLPSGARTELIRNGLQNAARFSSDEAIAAYLRVYQAAIRMFTPNASTP